jgi:hypothetical protein
LTESRVQADQILFVVSPKNIALFFILIALFFILIYLRSRNLETDPLFSDQAVYGNAKKVFPEVIAQTDFKFWNETGKLFVI